MDKKTYFFENNKSGCKTTEKYLSKHEPETYKEVINKYQNLDISFKEKIYLFINDLEDVPKCSECGKPNKFQYILSKGYSYHCSMSCLNKSKEHKEKIIESNLLKYGVKSHNHLILLKKPKKRII